MACLLCGCTNHASLSPLQERHNNWQTTASGKQVMTRAQRVSERFNDPMLAQLLWEVLAKNNDLAVAGFRLRQAWLAAGLVEEARFPGVSATSSATNSQQLKPRQESTESWQSGVTVGWELDLWGKISRQRDQSVWQAQASESDRLATALSLIKTTAELYWSIALNNAQLKNYDAQIVISQQLVDLAKSRYQAGEVASSDLYRAEQNMMDLTLTRDALRATRSRNRRALAILFDSNQRRPEKDALPDAGEIPGPVSVPVKALSGRPDVKSAEMKLRAALSGSDIARLNFYPTLSVNGVLGSASAVFSQWFSYPSRSVSGDIALPFLQWRTVMLTIEQADLDVKAAEADFRSVIWKALAETENAISDRQHALTQFEMYNRYLQLSQALWRQEKVGYEYGENSFQDTLQAQSAWLQAQNNVQGVNYNYLSETLKLWLTFDAEQI